MAAAASIDVEVAAGSASSESSLGDVEFSSSSASEQALPAPRCGGGRQACGSGCLVAAAFIGPGTITTCSIAGSLYGLKLLWTITFSMMSAFVLQEMSARAGLVTGQGLAEIFRHIELPDGCRRGLVASVCVGIGLVTALFEAGNVAGAALGLAYLVGQPGMVSECAVLVGLLAALLALSGVVAVQFVMAGVVAAMSVVFVICATASGPSAKDVVVALVRPQIPEGALGTVLALIGTTIVCYNLFLQSSAVARSTKAAEASLGKLDEGRTSLGDGGHSKVWLTRQLVMMRLDTALGILMGGIISTALIVTSAASFGEDLGGAGMSLRHVAEQLRILIGDFASVIFYVGLFCAGLSSAITAPLAAEVAVSEVLGWQGEEHRIRSSCIWAAVITLGTLLAALPFLNSIVLIVFAQVVNALLLPLFAGLLVWVASQTSIMGNFRNRPCAVAAGTASALVTVALSVYNVGSIFA